MVAPVDGAMISGWAWIGAYVAADERLNWKLADWSLYSPGSLRVEPVLPEIAEELLSQATGMEAA